MNIRIIERAKRENWMICVYGLGYLGKKLYKRIPELFGLSAGLYCDGEDSKVDRANLPEMVGVYKKDLLNVKKSAIVFILLDDPYDIEVQRMLSVNSCLHTVTLRELARMESVMRLFYGDELFEKYRALPDCSILEK